MGHWGVLPLSLAMSPYFSVIFIFCMKKGDFPRTCRVAPKKNPAYLLGRRGDGVILLYIPTGIPLVYRYICIVSSLFS